MLTCGDHDFWQMVREFAGLLNEWIDRLFTRFIHEAPLRFRGAVFKIEASLLTVVWSALLRTRHRRVERLSRTGRQDDWSPAGPDAWTVLSERWLRCDPACDVLPFSVLCRGLLGFAPPLGQQRVIVQSSRK